MKILINNLIPFPGYTAMNIFGILFVRKDRQSSVTGTVINHERIHTEQQKEVTIVGAVLAAAFWYFLSWWSLLFLLLFYGWYILEWVFKVFWYGELQIAYHAIGFEKEAFCNEADFSYLDSRKRFAWLKYIFRSVNLD